MMEAILGQSAPLHMIRKTRTKFFNTSNNRLVWDRLVTEADKTRKILGIFPLHFVCYEVHFYWNQRLGLTCAKW